MENIVFYIKYKDNQPVKIQTHFDHNRNKREQPLSDVADVIGAAKQALAPRFDSTPSDELTLHAAVDAEALRPGLSLVDVASGHTDDNPLIIKSKNDMEVELSQPQFFNTISIDMTPEKLVEWLKSSATSSSANLAEEKIVSQQDVNADVPIEFSLAGREESLNHIADCFQRIYKNRSSQDRNMRPIPVCTGVPGLGKTRLMHECSSNVLDRTGIKGKRLSTIISFGNDGNAFGWVDQSLGIQCSFAWRVLHSFFKAHVGFDYWMRNNSPANRRELKLRLVLETIELHWSTKVSEAEKILVFIGIDEYQKLGDQKSLNLLLDSLCDSSYMTTTSRAVLFSMLAGTDLNMTKIARTSHPNVSRIPIGFLTHAESMEAIGPYISRHHSGFVVSEVFAWNVYYLGGVPRLLTKFAENVVKLEINLLNVNTLRNAREAILAELQYPDLSVSNIVTLLATSFTNTRVNNLKWCPFSTSSSGSAKDLNWSQMVSNGMCLVKDDGRVIVPFHVISQVLARKQSEWNGLNDSEKELLLSLEDLSKNVEIPLSNVPEWLSWETFGAHFYRIRMNSFLVLGRTKVLISDILAGARFGSAVFDTEVFIRAAKVFDSNEQYGPDLPQKITRHRSSFVTVDWVGGDTIQIVLNGIDGIGVDIFFALERTDGSGYIVVLDQRKRLGTDITQSTVSKLIEKLPTVPRFFYEHNLEIETVFGLMSIYSDITVDTIPDSTFFVSNSDSFGFHGSFVDHPGCTTAIDVNTGLKTSIQQLFKGPRKRRQELAESIIQFRKNKKRIVSFEQLSKIVSQLNGELDDLALRRIKF